ncbi:adenylate/guanylate cyclase domain-containing protein [Roseofilum sp. BLCC_M154]|uniref:Adenylate/guanylate cyclase domain-containing protein n=1 Tax=Roseofilum acuticapitatum BLCC-M154 TaxID=3022444 RepID=A0ABT7AS70_9CYAN|nr:adenylate/guanylate cyclase domain-containing protein [Roseofilum acuticapitatum]MDJ1169279.1 adenylate/guanylate cyclase domain-containing protein [Roseofilum acuticapitatum BLCC-M154]
MSTKQPLPLPFKDRSTLSLRFLLVVPFVLELALVVGLIGYLSFRNGQKSVNQLATRLSGEVTHRIQEHLKRFADTPHLFLKMNEAAIASQRFDPDNFDQVIPYFWQQVQIHPWVRSLYYGNTQGDFIMVNRDPTPRVYRRDLNSAPNRNIYHLDAQGNPTNQLIRSAEYDPRTRPWYQAAVQAKTATWSPIYLFSASEDLGITPVLPLYDDQGTLKGVLGVDYTLTQISHFLASLEISDTGEAFIMERSGKLVASSTPELPFIETPDGRQRIKASESQNPLIVQAAQQIAALASLEEHQELMMKWEGERYFLEMTTVSHNLQPSEESLKGLDWVVVVIIPEADFMAQINANTRSTIALCAVALIGALGLGLVICRSICRPIFQLSQGVKAIAKGETVPKIYGGRIEELDQLAQGFNQMVHQLNISFQAWEEMNQNLELQVQERTKALEQAQEHFQTAFRLSPHPLFISAIADGCLLEVNDSFCEILGYSLENLLHHRETERQFWVNPQEHQRLVQVIETQGTLHHQQVELKTASGEIKTLLLSGAKIQWDGHPCVLYAAYDISDRHRAILALREQQQYLRLILDNIPQQVFWKDTDCVFLGCNRNWSEAAGLESPETVIGKTDYDLLPVHLADEFRAKDREIMASDTPQHHMIAKKVKPGQDGEPIWLDISKIPIHDANDRVIGLLGVIEDITLRKNAEDSLRLEQAKSEQLLLNIFPQTIADQLKQNDFSHQQVGVLIAEHYPSVTILFADLVGFTPLSSNLRAHELVELLNRIFSQFDHLCEKYQLEKIKTIGDAYMVAGGLPVERPDHAQAIADMALEMQSLIRQFETPFHQPFQIRIGINTGPVVAGVIGTRKFIYDLWGDAVNVASRMESQGEPGQIQVTHQTYELLRNNYHFHERGKIEVKGKGEMFTYWLLGQ